MIKFKTNNQKVKEFMEAFGQKVQSSPNFPDESVLNMRMKLIEEELDELVDALYNKDMTEAADGLTDLLYVIYGMGWTLGIDLDKTFDEVHRSNMTKLGTDGKPIYRKDGKVQKGPNYTPPNLRKVLYDRT